MDMLDTDYGGLDVAEWLRGRMELPDTLLPTDNGLDIPALRPDRQPRGAELPWRLYGELKRDHDMEGRGTVHFYTDDDRYPDIYQSPGKLLRMRPSCIVEPNYSLFDTTPVAFGLQQIYKKRWIARSMQDEGIGVLVDLNVANKWYAYNLVGVPAGWRSFCTRGYASRPNALEMEWRLAVEVAGTEDILFVVYSGGETARRFCCEHGGVYVSPLVTVRRRQDAVERMRRNVAVPLPELARRGGVAERMAAAMREQVSDYTGNNDKDDDDGGTDE